MANGTGNRDTSIINIYKIYYKYIYLILFLFCFFWRFLFVSYAFDQIFRRSNVQTLVEMVVVAPKRPRYCTLLLINAG